MQFCQLFYYYLGSGKLTIGDFSSEQLLHDFDEAHMAFGQVSARTRARTRTRQTRVRQARGVIFAFRSTNDEKRERSRNSSLGRGQAGRKIFATFCF